MKVKTTRMKSSKSSSPKLMDRLSELEVKHGIGEIAYFVNNLQVSVGQGVVGGSSGQYFWLGVGSETRGFKEEFKKLGFKGSSDPYYPVDNLLDVDQAVFDTPDEFRLAIVNAVLNRAGIHVETTSYSKTKIYWDFSQKD